MGRRFREPSGVPDGGQAPEAGVVLFDQIGDVLERDIRAVEAALDSPELLEQIGRAHV